MSDAQPSPSSTPVARAASDAPGGFTLLVMFFCAACWILLASLFALIASIKFHGPGFLAGPDWLTYGRVQPAYMNCLLYGFCLQAGLGVALWLLGRLGRTRIALPGLAFVGALLWNAGVVLGVGGILWGDSTGFECLEMLGYAAWCLVLGYLLIGLTGVLTFHQRRARQLFVSQWFIFAALFWFPWIYATAELLLVNFPVRGAAQVAIGGFYSANLLVTWLALVGLAAAFYFIPRLTRRDLHSRYLALFTFWMLILCGGWTGISNGAPLPAWMPACTFVATMLLFVPLLAVALNVYRTLYNKPLSAAQALPLSSTQTPPAAGQTPAPPSVETDKNVRPPMPPGEPPAPRSGGNTALQFVTMGTVALLLAWLLKILIVGVDVIYPVALTWLTPAQVQLNVYGFFCLVMFGAIYAILPLITQTDFPWPRLVRVHFWLALLGVLLIVLPLIIGGVIQARQLHDPDVAFMTIVKSTLTFLRVSTTGCLLLALGHLVFVFNVATLADRLYRTRTVAAYAAVTSELTPVEVKA